jgi:hypothetical protein
MTVLRSYKITNDNGFAPNPYHGCLTLATCMPYIRLSHQPGQWLAGFTSGKLNGDLPGQERLIFLALINKKLPLEEYYEQYPQKRPENLPSGDNIYKLENGKFVQVENRLHDEDAYEDDVNGKNALLAEEFYYFGIEAMTIPSELRPDLLKGQTKSGRLTEGQRADDFINYVKKYAAQKYPGKSGMLAEPHVPVRAKTK